jgi:hypothetical protein
MDFNLDTGTITGLAGITTLGSSLAVTSPTGAGDGSVIMPTGQTAQRPVSPATGATRFNTNLQVLETWDGTIWRTGSTTLAALGDVTVATPSSGQVLQFNGTTWSNGGSSAPSSAAGTLSSWTLVSGSRYYADFAHNLGTNNLVVQLFDNTTNAIVQADSIVLTTTNSIRVTVIGNTRNLRIVVIANGMYVTTAASGSTILEGLFVNRPAAGIVDRLYLAYDTKVWYRDNGTTWDIMAASSGVVKAFTFYPNSLDSPNTADFAVNALAPVISDPTNTALNVRSFSNTVEQGVAMTVPVPVGATTVTFTIRGRSATAPATASTVTHKIYSRVLPNNAAMGAWSAATTFTAMTVPTNAYYQLYTQSYTIGALGLSTGNTYHLELTRAIGGVAYAWLVAEVAVSFT